MFNDVNGNILIDNDNDNDVSGNIYIDNDNDNLVEETIEDNNVITGVEANVNGEHDVMEQTNKIQTMTRTMQMMHMALEADIMTNEAIYHEETERYKPTKEVIINYINVTTEMNT